MDTKRPSTRIALIDGNSFYCSCERAMRPAYEGRPLVVLSNNDGCAIARTQEAKNLGIAMGAPWFQIKHLADTHGLVALSANFNLYGDLSNRMMNVIGQFSPRQEIYSIDESFLDLTGVSGTGREIGSEIRQRVRQWVGIPTCVGIGPTKTLAKLANHLAKKLPRLEGVCDLSGLATAELMCAIRHVAIEDVWGVGRKLAPKLQALHINTAADLAQADWRVLRDRFSIVLAKTARELAGEQCMEWEDMPAEKQQIMCSRSFGRPVLALQDLEQAVSTFTSRAAEKLRAQDGVTTSILVFIRTSYSRDDPQYSGGTVVRLLRPIDDTASLVQAALQGLHKIYREGFKYAKAGICLLDLSSQQQACAQGSLFSSSLVPNTSDKPALMSVLDGINQRYGRSTISAASSFAPVDAVWKMKQERMTPAYTTDWGQIIDVWK
ncbi:Y-family DNA polymerase [Alcaligenes faecalis]|uniref:Y-family DNA polymerase n=1 Tax=Alcaligenes faecalis TaxID=511 RepID=UPI001C837B69|nr:Y-family DNA polymerase [Alcaligenes faecalis]MBX6963891.1 Y-family DNA polymerase [Providencia rettgeri]MBX7030541.1 Y-family DNA polymerase [Alcaligenes faecalis]